MTEPSALMRPTTLTDAMALAKVLADSDLVPKEFRGKPANCMVAMQMGAEIGLNPFQAVQSIAVINGKPSIYGDAGLGLVMASGLLESIDETDDGETATCALVRKGYKAVSRTFSAADAQRIIMYERDAQGNMKQSPLGNRVMWKNHPRRMRQMRARWWAMRDLFPDVLKGLRGAEEIEGVIDVTPGEVVASDPFPELEPKALPSSGEVPQLPSEAVQEEILPPEGAVSFELNGIHYATQGITREQLIETFRLVPAANKKCGKGAAEYMLLAEFGLTSRKDLTEETGEKFLVRLREMAGEA